MKVWSTVAVASRYALAATACISLVEFLFVLLYGQHTEETGRLLGQSFGTAVICGLGAGIWFYRAKRVHPSPQGAAQVKPEPPTQDNKQSPDALRPPDSMISPVATSGTGPTIESPGPRLGLKKYMTVLVVGIALGTVVPLLVLTEARSRPRFVHQSGPPELLFDTRTKQECWAGPVQRDNGIREMDRAGKRLAELNEEAKETWNRDSDACLRALRATQDSNPLAPRPLQCRAIDNSQAQFLAAAKVASEASARVEYLRKHPDQQKVIQVDGLPYCKDIR